jgi:hypothetical protein
MTPGLLAQQQVDPEQLLADAQVVVIPTHQREVSLIDQNSRAAE